MFDTYEYNNDDFGYELFEESMNVMTLLMEAKTAGEKQDVLNKKVQDFKQKVEKLKDVDGREKDKKGLIKYGLGLITLLVGCIMTPSILALIVLVISNILIIMSSLEIGYKERKAKEIVNNLQVVKQKAKKQGLDTKKIDKLIDRAAEIQKQETKRDRTLKATLSEQALFFR